MEVLIDEKKKPLKQFSEYPHVLAVFWPSLTHIISKYFVMKKDETHWSEVNFHLCKFEISADSFHYRFLKWFHLPTLWCFILNCGLSSITVYDTCVVLQGSSIDVVCAKLYNSLLGCCNVVYKSYIIAARKPKSGIQCYNMLLVNIKAKNES
jgi:hypothetical protein